MKIAVLGSGARESTIVSCLRNAFGPGAEIFVLPGNAGMEGIAIPVSVKKANDVVGICSFAKDVQPDLVIPGPEEPLVKGIGNRLAELGISCLGPRAEAARLEGSKVFAKRFMRRHNIRTADFRIFDAPQKVYDYINERGTSGVVFKADGLCGGKGVLVPEDYGETMTWVEDVMVKKKFGDAGNRILIEKRLHGAECSFIVATDGNRVIPLLPAADYKRRFNGDKGRNTGGMGAYAPNPLITPNLHEEIMEDFVWPTIRGMKYEGMPYFGFLYFGLMLAEDGIYLLEYNVRLGDPETSAILPLLAEHSMKELILGFSKCDLSGVELEWLPKKAVTVVLVDENYPYVPSVGMAITGIEEARKFGALVFPAGVDGGKLKGTLDTGGGRILGVTGIGDTFTRARETAYACAEVIQFKGKDLRRDIAAHLV